MNSANDDVVEIALDESLQYRYVKDENSIRRISEPFKLFEQIEARVHPEDKKIVHNITTPENLREILEKAESVYFECRVKMEESNYRWHRRNNFV